MNTVELFTKSADRCSDRKELDTFLKTVSESVQGPFWVWVEPCQGSTKNNGEFYTYEQPMLRYQDEPEYQKEPAISFDDGLIIQELRILTGDAQYHFVRQMDDSYRGVVWLYPLPAAERSFTEKSKIADFSKKGNLQRLNQQRLLHPKMSSYCSMKSMKSVTVSLYYLDGVLVNWMIFPPASQEAEDGKSL